MTDNNNQGGNGDGKTEIKPEVKAPDPSVQTDPAAADFDPSKLSEEQFAKIYNDPRLFKHERFKSLNDRAKKADEYEKEKSDAENKKLEEEKKYEELNTKQKQKIADLETEVQTTKVNNALTIALSKEKVIDVDGALTLINRSAIKLNDAGEIEGVTEAIEALKKEKSYLFGEGGTQPLGTNGGNGGDGNTNTSAKRFRLSQISDPKFFKENQEEILRAQFAGNIIDDVNV